MVDGGTIFLDEVAELPLSTQVRLLRVLESGEFFKVGSSKVIKTDVRVVAATNVNIPEAIEKGKFRQDLYYRLNTVPIMIPPLRDRKEDILLLFKKFASDFAEKYRMPPLVLGDDAIKMLENYRWPGNIRQLKNVTEQISIIEKSKNISVETLRSYLPRDNSNALPVLFSQEREDERISERDLLYKVLFDMRRDLQELKKTVAVLMENDEAEPSTTPKTHSLIKPFHPVLNDDDDTDFSDIDLSLEEDEHGIYPSEVITESLSLQDKEKDMIRIALEKHSGKRKSAAQELGISERTLYRKIKEYEINL